MVKEWSALYVCDTFDDYKSEIVALEVTNIRNISKQFNLMLDFMDIRCYISLIPLLYAWMVRPIFQTKISNFIIMVLALVRTMVLNLPF